MMGDSQYLHKSVNLAVNQVKVKNLENGASNVWGKNNA